MDSPSAVSPHRRPRRSRRLAARSTQQPLPTTAVARVFNNDDLLATLLTFAPASAFAALPLVNRAFHGASNAPALDDAWRPLVLARWPACGPVLDAFRGRRHTAKDVFRCRLAAEAPWEGEVEGRQGPWEDDHNDNDDDDDDEAGGQEDSDDEDGSEGGSSSGDSMEEDSAGSSDDEDNEEEEEMEQMMAEARLRDSFRKAFLAIELTHATDRRLLASKLLALDGAHDEELLALFSGNDDSRRLWVDVHVTDRVPSYEYRLALTLVRPGTGAEPPLLCCLATFDDECTYLGEEDDEKWERWLQTAYGSFDFELSGCCWLPDDSMIEMTGFEFDAKLVERRTRPQRKGRGAGGVELGLTIATSRTAWSRTIGPQKLETVIDVLAFLTMLPKWAPGKHSPRLGPISNAQSLALQERPPCMGVITHPTLLPAIASFLPASAIAGLCAVSHAVRAAASSDSIWRPLALARWPLSGPMLDALKARGYGALKYYSSRMMLDTRLEYTFVKDADRYAFFRDSYLEVLLSDRTNGRRLASKLIPLTPEHKEDLKALCAGRDGLPLDIFFEREEPWDDYLITYTLLRPGQGPGEPPVVLRVASQARVRCLDYEDDEEAGRRMIVLYSNGYTFVEFPEETPIPNCLAFRCWLNEHMEIDEDGEDGRLLGVSARLDIQGGTRCHHIDNILNIGRGGVKDPLPYLHAVMKYRDLYEWKWGKAQWT